MSNHLAMILTALVLLTPVGAGLAVAQQQPREAPIVGGKRIQPRADQFSGPNATPDVSSTDAKDIDQLYKQVLRDSAAPNDSGDVANPKPPAPTDAPKPR